MKLKKKKEGILNFFYHVRMYYFLSLSLSPAQDTLFLTTTYLLNPPPPKKKGPFLGGYVFLK